jgi:hypothetical protein
MGVVACPYLQWQGGVDAVKEGRTLVVEEPSFVLTVETIS